MCSFAGPASQFRKELQHLADLRCHLGSQGVLRIVRETDHERGFVSQCENLLDEFAVIPVCLASLIRCARRPCLVKRFAEVSIIGVSQDRVIGRQVEIQPPPLLVLLYSHPSGPRNSLFGQAGDLRLGRGMKMPGVRRILYVLIKPGLRRCKLLHQFLEPGLFPVRQRNAREPEIP